MKKANQPIPRIVYRAQGAVLWVVDKLGVGTNLCIHDGLMTLMRGELLESRGALIPALDGVGLNKEECLRVRGGIQKGSWSVGGLLKGLWEWIRNEGKWEALKVGGYTVKAVDTLGIYRPRLEGCKTKHYSSVADKALPAINFGVISAIGKVGEQKVSLPEVVVRGDEGARSEEELMQKVCERAKGLAYSSDVYTADRRFGVMVMIESGMQQVVVRRTSNFTVRRKLPANPVPQDRKPGRPKPGRPRKQGEVIRPLERKYKGKVIAPSKPDEVQTWVDQKGHTLVAHIWHDVVLTQQQGWSEERKALNLKQSWTIATVKHPDYPTPMVILYNLPLSAQQAYAVMDGRWGAEHLPLVSKQILGAHRSFVFEPEMCFRLPELSFVAAAILMVVAASCEPMPTGWWDTRPKPTAGRLRRQLRKVGHLRVLDTPPKLRKKNSYTAHLPPGFHSAIKKGRKLSET